MNFWGPGTGIYGRGRWRGHSTVNGSPSPALKRLLVIQFGQLGDTVLSLPALDLLRDQYPDAELTLGCGMPAHELLDLWGRADRIVPLDRVRTRDTNPIYAAWLICQFVSRVWHPTPDAVIVMHPNDEMYLVAYCTAAKRRAGVVVKPGFFSRLLNEPFTGGWKSVHASQSYVALVRQFCGLPAIDPETPPVPKLELAPNPVRNGRIAIHVGAGRVERRVAPETWLEVARALHSMTGKEIAFVSGPEEQGIAEQLAGSLPGGTVLSGLNIANLARELAASGFFIGTDSGPGHLAASVQTPVLTVIEEHKTARYRTLGASTSTVRHRNVREVTPTMIIEAALRHPSLARRAS
jgi:ADP-heptose:LPS heptosyltransferase